MVAVQRSINSDKNGPDSDHNLFTRLAKNSTVVLAAKGIEISASLLILMILSRALGLTRFGDYAFINSLVLAFQPLVNLELNTILIREMARESARSRAFLGGGLLLKLMLIGCFVVAAGALGNLLEMAPVVRMAFYLAVAGEIFQQINWVFSAVFMARERMEFEPLLSLIYRLISVGGILFIAAFCPKENMISTGFLAVFAVLALAQATRTVAGIVIAARFLKSFRIQWSLSIAREILQQSWIMGIATFCTGLSLRVDVFFLKHFAGSDAVALFHLPHMLTLQVQIIATSMVTALFPVISRWSGDRLEKDRLRVAQDVGIRLMNTLGLLIALVIALFPDWIIVLLGGQSFRKSAGVLVVLCWCIPVLFLNYLGANFLTALKKQHLLIYGAASSLIMNSVLDYLMVPIYGPSGAAIATIISYSFQLLIVLTLLRIYSGNPIHFTSALALPWTGCLVASSLAWWMENSLGPASPPGIAFRIGLLIIVIAGMWMLLPISVKNHITRRSK